MNRLARLGGLLFLWASGCHSVPLSFDPLSGAETKSAPALFEIDWWRRLVVPPMWEYEPKELASPVVDAQSERVLVGTRDGYLRCLSSAEGTEAWAFKTGGPFTAGPLVRDGVAYVPGGDGTLYALKARSGELIWKYQSGEELATTPVFADGRVLVASHSDSLFAVDAASGKWLWQYRRDPPPGFTVRGAARPAVADGAVFMGFSDGWLVALAVDSGALKWERRLTTTAATQFLDADASPTADDSGRIYAASFLDGLYALRADSGEVDWHTTRQGITSLVSSGALLFASGEQQLVAITPRDGRTAWAIDLKGRAGHVPVMGRGLLVVPVSTSLLFVDPQTGKPQTAWDPGKGVSATPTVRGERMYVLSNLGTLFAVTLR